MSTVKSGVSARRLFGLVLGIVPALAIWTATGGAAWAQRADTVLVNGRILTVDDRFSVREAIAIRDGRITALGKSTAIRRFAGPKTRVIDLQGRTVIPGLVDSHIHAIRAALSFSTEVNWIGAASIEEALGRSGVLRITHKIGPDQATLYETKAELRNRWLDFKFQIRFSTLADGRIKAWLNNEQIVDYTGVNAYPENAQTGFPNPGWFYFKMGLYRDLMVEPMAIYIDEYRKKELPGNAFQASAIPIRVTAIGRASD